MDSCTRFLQPSERPVLHFSVISMQNIFQSLAAFALVGLACSAQAHVVLAPGGATAGSTYEAVFSVGHACKGAQATTAMAVQLPANFQLLQAQERPGWLLSAPQPGTGGGEVRWTARTPQDALRTQVKGEFSVRGVLPKTPGVLHFPVRQFCDVGQADWVEIAPPGTKVAMPAAQLEVLPVGVAPVQISDPWVRFTVPGQGGTGAFMGLQAPSGLRLVAVETPVAKIAEIHSMSMEGDTMRMRPVPFVELPARQAVALAPGGYHLMLMELQQVLAVGQRVELTLVFEDAAGQRSRRTVAAEVRAGAARPGAAGAAHHH
jgi:copper(I)-binding protein